MPQLGLGLAVLPQACALPSGWLLPFTLGVALGVVVTVVGYSRNG